MSITLDSIIAAAQQQVSSDIGGETAILNLKNGVYYGLDPVGTRIWELIQEPITVKVIKETILAEYEVESERCENDLLALLNDMAKENLIDVTEDETSDKISSATAKEAMASD